ncbi:TPA: transcriptional regulator [Patescibacteria group bacterium]|nr:transcriptional regulator [Candidatus Gracilibacteria bacterium]
MNTIFKALADPKRRQICKILQQGDKSVSELQTNFSTTQEALSHHLKILKSANIVSNRREGQFIYYSLNSPVFEDVMNYILSLYYKHKE